MTDLTALGLPADLPEIAAPTFMGGYDGVSADLSQQQKAAIIVRVLLSDGRTMSLSQLTPEIQVSLTREIGAIRQIDQATLSSVVDEFIGELDGGGMSFSGGPQEALSMLDGSISAETARRLIPTVIDQNPCAHLRMPRDMIFHGWSMRLFQAWQHSATMSS